MIHLPILGTYLEVTGTKQGKNISMVCMHRSLANKADTAKMESARQSKL